MKKFRPGYPVSAGQLNQIDHRSNTNKAPTEDGIEYEQSAGGTGRIPTERNPLRILKVTGTVAGGYSFQEVYDIDADGAYTDDVQGVTSTTNSFLVPKTGVTLATNDLVVARQNPDHWEKWEMICELGATTLDTSNTDGTESGSTSDMRFDKTTGVQITQGVGFDTVSTIEADFSQWGVVSTNSQVWNGTKRVVGTVQVTPTNLGYTVIGTVSPNEMFVQRDAPAITRYTYVSSIYTDYNIPVAGYNQTVSGQQTSGKEGDYFFSTFFGSTTVYAAAGALDFCHVGITFLNGFRVRASGYGGLELDIYVDQDEATHDASAFAPQWDYPVRHKKDFIADDGFTHGARRGGVDKLGVDATITIGTTNYEFAGGHLVGSSPVSPPPSPPVPPPPVPPTYSIGGTVSSGPPGYVAEVGRTVTLSGANSGSTTTNGSGGYTFPGLASGSTTVTLDSTGLSGCQYYIDAGAVQTGFAATFTVSTDHSVTFHVTASSPPAPPVPPVPPETPPPP